MPGFAPHFAVGHGLEPGVFLHFDHLADGLVLDGAQLLGRDAPGFAVGARLQHLARAQQTADMVGAEGRLGAAGHGCDFSRADGIAQMPVQPRPARRLAT